MKITNRLLLQAKQKRKNDASHHSQEGAPAKRLRDVQNLAKWNEFQLNWQNHVEENDLAIQDRPPEALIRFNYRYVVNDNTGALKYEPVTVDQVLNNYDELERVYYRRQINDPSPMQTRQQSRDSASESMSQFDIKIHLNPTQVPR